MTQRSFILPLDHSLNGYRIGPELGNGGFGVTYQAVHESRSGRRVAIKEYFPQVLSFRDLDGIGVCPNTQGRKPVDSGEQSYYDWGLSRFLDEARILAEIQHPQVVRIRDHFTANGTAYIVMDYEEGEPLSTLLNREHRLPEERVRRLLDELLAALEAVHARGYLHRDLKPDNVYLRARDGSAMLIDFGAARQALFHHSHHITGLISPGYSPPEQYATSRGDRYGPWTDIYALGAILYRCISGQTPLQATDRLLGDTLAPARQIGREGYSQKLLALVDRALVLEPHQRFQSVAELRAALREPGTETLVPAAGLAFGELAKAGFTVPSPARTAARAPGRRWAVGASIALLSLTAAAAGLVMEQGWSPAKIVQRLAAGQPAGPPGPPVDQPPPEPLAATPGDRKPPGPPEQEPRAEAPAAGGVPGQAAAGAGPAPPDRPWQEAGYPERAKALQLARAEQVREDPAPGQRRADEQARQRAEAERRWRVEQEAARRADDKAYAAAKDTHTMAAYKAYLQGCSPVCAHRNAAKAALVQLEDAREQALQARIQKLKARFEEHLKARRLARSPQQDDDHALGVLTELAVLKPADPFIAEGKKRIALQYEKLAREALEQKDYAAAGKWLEKGKSIQPGREQWAVLARQLKETQAVPPKPAGREQPAARVAVKPGPAAPKKQPEKAQKEVPSNQPDKVSAARPAPVSGKPAARRPAPSETPGHSTSEPLDQRSLDKEWSRIYRQNPNPVRLPHYRGPWDEGWRQDRYPPPQVGRGYAGQAGAPVPGEGRDNPYRTCRPADACGGYPPARPADTPDNSRRTAVRRHGLIEVLEEVRKDIQRQLGIPLPPLTGSSSDEES